MLSSPGFDELWCVRVQSMFLTRLEQVNGHLAQVEIKCLISCTSQSSPQLQVLGTVIIRSNSVGHNILSAVFSHQLSREI